MQLAKIKLEGGAGSYDVICPNDMCLWRAQSFWKKEPHTIKWLDELEPGKLLWDVGANVGMYALYAATRGVRVDAFEPESQNYSVLNANIKFNHLEDRLTAYPIALGDATAIDTLYLTMWDVGASCHQFGGLKSYSGEKDIKPDFRQGSICMRGITIAELTGRWPNYVKIDVDGHEPQVVEGLLGIDGIESMIVETNWNREDHRDMISMLEQHGFEWSQEQYDDAKRKDGNFAGVGELILRRGGAALQDHVQDHERPGADVPVPASAH